MDTLDNSPERTPAGHPADASSDASLGASSDGSRDGSRDAYARPLVRSFALRLLVVVAISAAIAWICLRLVHSDMLVPIGIAGLCFFALTAPIDLVLLACWWTRASRVPAVMSWVGGAATVAGVGCVIAYEAAAWAIVLFACGIWLLTVGFFAWVSRAYLQARGYID
ncbi:hypothetical protein [Corynebacterium argentoratense]|uniref:hypothetical protein n=1 Tax=Corynebacterium argentoratense TaxID=42817 RepID=UPI001F4404AB|nr:hypothetical protein [Corynebacterium argentoratense]MCF1766367.1 hypothetical protein [Corynebacterium argentoratense]